MTTPFKELKIHDDSIALTIPTCLEKSLKCLTKNPIGDVSKIYKITFRNIRNEQLYVKDEYSLRDVLKEYCIYKKLCQKIEQEMKSVDIEFEIVDYSVRLKNKTDPVVKFVNPGDVSVIKRGGKYCDPGCGQKSSSTPKAAPVPDEKPIPNPPLPPPAENQKCCVIL